MEGESGLATQRRILNDHGLRDDRIFTDVASGKNMRRPSWQELRGMLKPGDTVVVPRIDRLARNLTEGLKTIEDRYTVTRRRRDRPGPLDDGNDRLATHSHPRAECPRRHCFRSERSATAQATLRTSEMAFDGKKDGDGDTLAYVSFTPGHPIPSMVVLRACHANWGDQSLPICWTGHIRRSPARIVRCLKSQRTRSHFRRGATPFENFL